MRNLTIMLISFLLPLAATQTVTAAEVDFAGELEAGYRFIDGEGNPDRAAEYDYLDSSPTLTFELSGSGGDNHLIADGFYLNENDYRAETHIDHGGSFMLDLRAERMFHNLDHLPYDQTHPEARADAVPVLTNPDDGTTSAGSTRAVFTDHDPNADYELEIDTYEVKLRARPFDWPAHLNLGYWRYERNGHQQLRFVDEGNGDGSAPFNPAGCANCHMQSTTRPLEQATDQFTASIDAHVGPVDLILDYLYRQFEEQAATPRDDFGSHWFGRTTPGSYTHDEIPDATLQEGTVKLHTNLAGGIVGAASFTLGQRENNSDLDPADVAPVISKTDYTKGAGDFTWIPDPRWTLNLRYRLLDQDNTNSETITSVSLPAAKADTAVRPNVDIQKSDSLAALAWRPSKKLTAKLELRHENLRRGQTGPADEFHSNNATTPVDTDLVWGLPAEENTTRIKLNLFGRPLDMRTLRLNAWYLYTHSDDPAYGTTLEDGHRWFASASYQPGDRWGASLNGSAAWGRNGAYQIVQFDGSTPVDFTLDRNEEKQNLNAGLWATPADRVTAGINYGFNRTRIEQALLIGNSPVLNNGVLAADSYAFLDEDAEYRQRVHTVSVNIGVQLLENLRCELSGHHTRSRAEFDPSFMRDYAAINNDPVDLTDVYYNADSAGIEQISELDLVQSGFKAGLSWSPLEQLICRLDYAYDDYEDKNSSAFDGSVQMTMASLGYRW